MSEHLSLEELSKFVWMERITPETMKLALRVNQHLLVCPDCAHQVEQMQTVYEQAQVLRRQRTQLNLANQKLQEINEWLLPKYQGVLSPKMGQEQD